MPKITPTESIKGRDFTYEEEINILEKISQGDDATKEWLMSNLNPIILWRCLKWRKHLNDEQFNDLKQEAMLASLISINNAVKSFRKRGIPKHGKSTLRFYVSRSVWGACLNFMNAKMDRDHYERTGQVKKKRRLTSDEKREVIAKLTHGENAYSIARKLGINRATIYRIRKDFLEDGAATKQRRAYYYQHRIVSKLAS